MVAACDHAMLSRKEAGSSLVEYEGSVAFFGQQTVVMGRDEPGLSTDRGGGRGVYWRTIQCMLRGSQSMWIR